MGEQDAGQGKAGSERVPDFIPGWFRRRECDPKPSDVEAVRYMGGDFPIDFLRPDEFVRPARPDHRRGVVLSARDDCDFGLAVPLDWWIVRQPDGALYVASPSEFPDTWVREEAHEWRPQRERHVPSGQPAAAEGTRRALILDTIQGVIHGTDDLTEHCTQCLTVTDAIESALLTATIETETRDNPYTAAALQRQLKGIDDVLDMSCIPRREASPLERVKELAKRHGQVIERLADRPIFPPGFSPPPSSSDEALGARLSVSPRPRIEGHWIEGTDSLRLDGDSARKLIESPRLDFRIRQLSPPVRAYDPDAPDIDSDVEGDAEGNEAEERDVPIPDLTGLLSATVEAIGKRLEKAPTIGTGELVALAELVVRIARLQEGR